MNTRSFLKTLGLTTAGVIAAPQILLAAQPDPTKYDVLFIKTKGNYTTDLHFFEVLRPHVIGSMTPTHPFWLIDQGFHQLFEVWERGGYEFNHVRVGDFIRTYGEKYSYWSHVFRTGHCQNGTPWIMTNRIDFPYPRDEHFNYKVEFPKEMEAHYPCH